MDNLCDSSIDAMTLEQLREQLKNLRDQYYDKCRRVCDECCLETANWAYDEDHNVVCTTCAGEPKCEHLGCESTDVYIHSHGCVALCDEHSREANGEPHCPRDHSEHKADPCDVCDERWAALDDGEPPQAPFSAEELARK